MKTLNYCLRKLLLSIMIITGLSLISFNSKAQAPTGNCVVLQQACNNDGKLVAIVTSGLTPPLEYQYYLQDGVTIIHSNINALSDTINNISSCYYVYITDNASNGLSLSPGMVPPFTIDAPIITSAECPDLGSAQITINGGTVPQSVDWYNYNYQYGAGNLVATGNPVNLPSGYFSAIITDANGCKRSYDSIWINNLTPINFHITKTAANCTNGTATIDNITGGIAPYTYQWSNGANTASIDNLISGNYSVTVTDQQGCYNSDVNFYIAQAVSININMTVNDATCLNNNGSVTSFASGGVPPYTYQYNNGANGQTITGLIAGSYLVTVTDANGCRGVKYETVNASTPITVTYTSTPSSCTSPTGSATLAITGGVTPYSIIWNTFPVQNSVSINNMPIGNYSFKITDANGCVRTGTVNIAAESSIFASISATNAVCPNGLGSASIYANGNNPPFSYSWNNSSTSQTLTNLEAGQYICTITDNVGCSVVKGTTVHESSPIHIGITSTPTSCLYSNDGNLYANPTGGAYPYSIHWSNAQTGANATNLTTGNYYCYVEDADGCTQSEFATVNNNASNNSCYCTIQGKVYVDQNNNCVYDAGEEGVENIMIHCSNFGYAFTNANGDYSFTVPTGNYTLSESIQSIYPLATCQSNSVNVNVTANSGCTNTVNFANAINPLHDLHIIRTNINNAIPGNSFYQRLIVKNDGTITEANIQLGFEHDGQLLYTNTQPNAYTQSNPTSNHYSVTTGFQSLSPSETTTLITNYQVPTNIPLGTSINFWDTTAHVAPLLTSWISDYTPWNNVSNNKTTIIGSFDPNFKEVIPAGTGTEGYILDTDSILNYVIHFQNTGTYFAQNVVIIDTLDSNLNWSSLKPGYSDHTYTTTVSETGIIKFTFHNINLPWATQNEINSRGLITYSIKQKPNLSVGTEIKNTAAIYFDYNEPVITNTTLNTIKKATSIIPVAFNQNFNIYPNPSTSEINIDLSKINNATSIKIYDLTGRVMQSLYVNKDIIQNISVNNLLAGIYFIEVSSLSGKKFTAKFIKN